MKKGFEWCVFVNKVTRFTQYSKLSPASHKGSRPQCLNGNLVIELKHFGKTIAIVSLANSSLCPLPPLRSASSQIEPFELCNLEIVKNIAVVLLAKLLQFVMDAAESYTSVFLITEFIRTQF